MTSFNCFEARISPYLSLYRFRLTSKTAYYLHLDRITHPNFVSKLGCEYGRSGEAQTRGLRIPNAARYQLRYTPIVIKFWSCKWSNLWSNTFLTVIFCFPYRPKIARLKGFRRLAPINVRNAAYAPKCGALSTALHPDIFDFLLCQPCDFRYNNPLHFPQKHSRTARLERVALLVVFSPQSFA